MLSVKVFEVKIICVTNENNLKGKIINVKWSHKDLIKERVNHC